MERPDDIDHINHLLADHDCSIETILIEGLTIAVREGRMSESDKQTVLNEYIERRNAAHMLYVGLTKDDTGKD